MKIFSLAFLGLAYLPLMTSQGFAADKEEIERQTMFVDSLVTYVKSINKDQAEFAATILKNITDKESELKICHRLGQLRFFVRETAYISTRIEVLKAFNTQAEGFKDKLELIGKLSLGKAKNLAGPLDQLSTFCDIDSEVIFKSLAEKKLEKIAAKDAKAASEVLKEIISELEKLSK